MLRIKGLSSRNLLRFWPKIEA